MDESRFQALCFVLFGISFLALCSIVLLRSEADFSVDGYTGIATCSGSCSLRGTVTKMTDRNATIFFTLEREVPIDVVFFVGSKAPKLAVGDCVQLSGIAQVYQGRQSIVANSLRACASSKEASENTK